jgi:hypothetical protein
MKFVIVKERKLFNFILICCILNILICYTFQARMKKKSSITLKCKEGEYDEDDTKDCFGNPLKETTIIVKKTLPINTIGNTDCYKNVTKTSKLVKVTDALTPIN